MKRNFKNTSAKVLAVALAVGMVATSLPATVADAKKKVKKPTLGKTKVTINVGKTAKITVKKNQGPKVKKVTIKLSKAQKKLVKITKKTKSYIKVKGLKAGKTTLKVKIKAGKKTYTQKLKVTVKGNTPSVTTPATSGQPVNPTPSPSAGTNTPAPTGATESPSPSNPAGPGEKTDITVKFDYEFPAARQVLFDEDSIEGYPSSGIDLRDYAKVVVKFAAAKELQVDEGWAGKCTISSTDEGLGFTAYTDGLMVKFFNDIEYKDGMYTFEFDIKAENLVKGYEFDDLELVDCIGVQLSGTSGDEPVNSYEDVTLKEIQFILPDPNATPDPNETPAPETTPVPTIDPSTMTDTTQIGDLALDSKSDITTLKACKDPSGNDAIRFPFTKTNQRVFFDVSNIDFTKIDKIVVKADAAAQMAFDLWSEDLDTTADQWWTGSYASDYPFYNAEQGTIATYEFDMSKLKEGADISKIGYLSLGSHNGTGVKDWDASYYVIYSIEFVEK